MGAFGIASQLQALIGEPLDVDRATSLLEEASDAVRDEVGQGIDLVEDDEIVLSARDGLLVLPELPVISVASVVDSNSTELSLAGGNVRAGILQLGRVPAGSGPFTVTYTHGHAEVPAVARRVTLQVAKRAYLNSALYVQETTPSGYAVNYGPALAEALSLTEAEKRDLDPLRP